MKTRLLLGGTITLMFIGMLFLTGCPSLEVYRSVPCKGTNYGGDMAPYEQTQICKGVCERHGLKYSNEVCDDYLLCGCEK